MDLPLRIPSYGCKPPPTSAEDWFVLYVQYGTDHSSAGGYAPAGGTSCISIFSNASVLSALCVGALFVVGCANGSTLPTSPSAAQSAPPSLSGGDAVSTATAFARSGTLHVGKECTQFNGTNGTFAHFGPLDSDVVLDLPGPGNNAAFGHCTLNAVKQECTFWGGTGKFTHFSATVEVSDLGNGEWRRTILVARWNTSGTHSAIKRITKGQVLAGEGGIRTYAAVEKRSASLSQSATRFHLGKIWATNLRS